MTDSEQTIATFAAQFNPPLKYTRTDRINGVPYPDAWSVSYWDDVNKIGVTAVAFQGQIQAFIEAAGQSQIAAGAGAVMAQALGMFGNSPALAANQVQPTPVTPATPSS